MHAVRTARKEWTPGSSDVIPGVQLHEWEREGWTYHAKGATSVVIVLRVFAPSRTALRVFVCDPDMADINPQASGCVHPVVGTCPDFVWLDEPELAFRQSRHGAVLRACHNFSIVARKTR